MGRNNPGGDFLGENFPGEDSPGGSLMGGNFLEGRFPVKNFSRTIEMYEPRLSNL